mgnify:CR=1 FL=1
MQKQEILNKYKDQIISGHINVLKENEIFVFGSNLAGIHGAGAAKLAMQWGARQGHATGLQGNTYAIPTKDKNITRTLNIAEIKPHVNAFIAFATQNKQYTFFVTEIGCGLAGYQPSQIAPLFKKAEQLNNVKLPITFWFINN